MFAGKWGSGVCFSRPVVPALASHRIFTGGFELEQGEPRKGASEQHPCRLSELIHLRA